MDARAATPCASDSMRSAISSAAINYPNNMYGQYNFTGVYTGFAYADFLLGIPQSTNLSIPNPPRYLRGTIWSVYAQDQFKVNQRLTLNYGLRWQLEGPYYDRYGSIANFDPALGSWVVPTAGSVTSIRFIRRTSRSCRRQQAGYPDGGAGEISEEEFLSARGLRLQALQQRQDRHSRRVRHLRQSDLRLHSAARLGGGPFSGSTTYNNVLTNGVPLFSFPVSVPALGHRGNAERLRRKSELCNALHPAMELDRGAPDRRRGHPAFLSRNAFGRSGLCAQSEPAATQHDSVHGSRRFFPIFNTITYYDNGGSQRYNGLQATVAKNYGNSLTFNGGLDLGERSDRRAGHRRLLRPDHREPVQPQSGVGQQPNHAHASRLRLCHLSVPVRHGRKYLEQ